MTFSKCIQIQTLRLAKAKWLFACAMAAVVISASGAPAHAQFFNGVRQGVVGGVMIDADGVVRNATIADQNAMLQQMRDQLKGAPADLKQAADRRMISLKGLQAAIAQSKADGKALPEEVLFLGGLTRIEHVFVYPEQNDIVISGPAENWVVGKNGSIVGEKSGRPVLYLDDLLTAFRSLEGARAEGISCSIDPTPEGIQQFEKVMNQALANSESNISTLEPMLREAFGPQTVRLTGMPGNSHMARVLVAADYQMKRYGMELAEPPVKGLPSYLAMVRNKNVSQLESRFWMASDYNPVQKSNDGLAWKISGPGIKALTEAEVVDGSGQRTQTGKPHPVAQKWADNFTKKMDEISVKDTVFGELRNVMDLCVLAALIETNGLAGTAGCDLSVLKGEVNTIVAEMEGVPKTLPAQCSFVKSSKGLVVSASGGVMIDSFSIASKVETDDSLAKERASVPVGTGSWVWN
jgi:Protein of unknown function (DUF1598)